MKLYGWKFPFSTLVCSQTLLKAPTNHQPDFRLWNREKNVIELFSLFFSPSCSFPCDWMCFIYPCGGWRGLRKRKKEGAMSRRRREGSSAQVILMKGVFHSFTLPVFPPFSWLRHLIKWPWIVYVTLSVYPQPPPPPLFLVSHTHILPSCLPSLSILTSSSIYLWLQASSHPFTFSQCRSMTTDKRSE